jgi:hypothetical protein
MVLRIYLREAVISIRTEIEFPEKMTAEQKLTVIQNERVNNGGYKSNVVAQSKGSDDYLDRGTILVTQRDPMGEYTGHYSVQKPPAVDITYNIRKFSLSQLCGKRFHVDNDCFGFGYNCLNLWQERQAGNQKHNTAKDRHNG